jgi:hypothetical protein
MDNPMRQDTTFPSGSVENGIIIKRTVEEEKVNARYLDHLHQEQHIQGYGFIFVYISLIIITNCFFFLNKIWLLLKMKF